MKIAGVDSKEWGLSLIRSEGILNLPARLDPVSYHWGDLIEPLTNKEDLFYEQNGFSLELFYEPPKGIADKDPAASLSDLLEYLDAQGSDYIALETPYKTARAKIVEIKDIEPLGESCGAFTMTLREALLQAPSFPSDLKIVDKEGLLINGYNVEENTGLILSECKEAHDIPPLRQSARSLYKTSELSCLREQGKLFLKLHGFYESPAALAPQLERFKAMLGSGGLKKHQL